MAAPDYLVKTPDVVAGVGETLRKAHGWVGVLQDGLAGKPNAPRPSYAAERMRSEIVQALLDIENVQRRLVQELER
jgi:hypothetical protein